MRLKPARNRQALVQVLMAVPRRRRQQLGWLFLLMLIGGGLEFLSLGAIVPFLTLLAKGAPNGTGGLWRLIPIGSESHALIFATFLFSVAVIASAGARLLLQLTIQRTVIGAGHELTVEIQRRSLMQPYEYHVGMHSSSLIASLDKVQQLVHGVFMPIMQAGAAGLISLFILVALVQIEPAPAILTGVFLAAAYGLTALFLRPQLKIASEDFGSTFDQRIRLVQDSSGGIRDIIIDRSQDVYLRAFSKIDLRFARAQIRIAIASSAPRFIIEAVGLVVIGGTAAWMVGEPGGISRVLPALGALALGGQRLLPLLHQTNQGWTAVAGNRAIIGDIASLLNLPIMGAAASDEIALPFSNNIILDDVTFHHQGSKRASLSGISVEIKHGSRTALIGRTGSGKTTLADLIMGLLRPSTGTIAIDGVKLDQKTIGRWHRNIAHVPQSIFLTDSSIARNVALTGANEGINEERLDRAIRLAQLEPFIQSLPNGLATRIGEHGIRLSGGQRQRIGIARALYKGSSFLVLDEATNALDEATEVSFLAALDLLEREGMTILIISHRPMTITGCTATIRLQAGKLT